MIGVGYRLSDQKAGGYNGKDRYYWDSKIIHILFRTTNELSNHKNLGRNIN